MDKNILVSKTFWFGAITAILPLFPSVSSFISANPQALAFVWGVAAIVLRAVTKGKVNLLP